MEETIEKKNTTADTLTLNEATRFLWEWRVYRNEGFWQVFFLAGFTMIILTIAPYFFPDLIKKLGAVVLVFPILIFFVSALSAYLLVVQYRLYKVADKKYRELLGEFVPQDVRGWIVHYSLGKVITIVFILYGTIIQAINGWVLVSLAKGILP